MRIQEFNSTTARAFHAAFLEDMKALGKKYDLNIQVGRMTYQDAKTISIPLSASVGDAPIEETPSGRLFLAMAPHYGFDKKDLGRMFKYKNQLYKITGWDSNARKYCLRTEIVNSGKVMRFEPSYVKRLLV